MDVLAHLAPKILFWVMSLFIVALITFVVFPLILLTGISHIHRKPVEPPEPDVIDSDCILIERRVRK